MLDGISWGNWTFAGCGVKKKGGIEGCWDDECECCMQRMRGKAMKRNQMGDDDDQPGVRASETDKSMGEDPHLDPQFAEPTHIHPSRPVAHPFTIHVRP